MPANSSQHARRKPSPNTLPSAASPKTKKGKLIALLHRKGGQEMTQLTSALGWLPHTVRAAITGLRKSGLNIERHVAEDGRVRYRIAPEAGR